MSFWLFNKFMQTQIIIYVKIVVWRVTVFKYSPVVHSPSHIREGKIIFNSFMLARGIIYIGGKWYGIEPLNSSSTFEHMFYRLEDMEHIPFRCGMQNDSLHHEIKMFVKQSVKYELSSNSTSSGDKLLRVNAFLFLSCGLQSKQSPQIVPDVNGLWSSFFSMVLLV